MARRLRRLPLSQGAFSLIELLVVIIVIGILASVAIQSMGEALEDARRIKTERELEMLAKAIVGDPSLTNGQHRTDFGYVGDIGAFPPNLDVLAADPGYSTWDGPYIEAGFAEDANGFKRDEWGAAYTYAGGTTISSSGGGSAMTKKLADAASDYLRNRVMGTVRDLNDSLPGDTYRDSVDVAVSIPNGAGGTVTKTYHPNATGGFLMDSLPVGTHPLRVIYTPEADTLFRYLTVLPRHKNAVEFQFAAAHFSSTPPVSPTADTLLFADFNVSTNGFSFQVDAFRGTSHPSHAFGNWAGSGGASGGGLRILLGGIDLGTVTNISGGWRATVTLSAPANLHLAFDYRLEMSMFYEPAEYGEVLASVDGTLYGTAPDDYVTRLYGTGSSEDTGWLTYDADLGVLGAGVHTIIIGGYNNQKTELLEVATVTLDNVVVVAE